MLPAQLTRDPSLLLHPQPAAPSTALARTIILILLALIGIGSTFYDPLVAMYSPARSVSQPISHTVSMPLQHTSQATVPLSPRSVEPATLTSTSSSQSQSINPLDSNNDSTEPETPGWVVHSMEAAAALILVPAIVMLMGDAASMWQQPQQQQQQQSGSAGEPNWLMAATASHRDDWSPWLKNNVPHKSDVAQGYSSDSTGSSELGSDGGDDGDWDEANSPRLTRIVRRNKDGELIGGWGHRLTEQEQEEFEEGDVLEQETIDKWAETDGVVPGERATSAIQKLFIRGFSSTVMRDEQDGELYAGFGHKLTEEEKQRYKEGDAVDAETLQYWLNRQILEMDELDDEDEESQEDDGEDGILTEDAER